MRRATLQGSTIGAYRLIDFLGAGGMGEVYRAVHLDSGRVVAVKILLHTAQGDRFVERFRHEARIQARLHHPNVARLYEFIEAGDHLGIVLEYVDGPTLDARLGPGGGLSIDDALRYFRQVVEAVAYVHANGIIHRDIKTGNIKISSSGQVKLLDFGIARRPDLHRFTATGMVVGTPECLSPEQVRGKEATVASDVWALGVLLYEMLTGRPPFEADNLIELYKKIDRAAFVPASLLRDGVPPELDALVARCLCRRPADRFTSAEALLQELDREPSRPEAPGAALFSEVRRMAGETYARVKAWSNRPRPDPEPAVRERRRRSTLEALRLQLEAHWKTIALMAGVVLLAVGAFRLLPPVSSDPPPPTCTFVAEGGASSLGMHDLIITVLEGTAEVYQRDVRCGRTPFHVRAPIGTTIDLELRRGAARRSLHFAMPASRSTYQISMNSGY